MGYQMANYQVIGQGANRLCVVDPDAPAFCLKFDISERQISGKTLRQILTYYFSSIFPALSENVIEWLAYRKLYIKFGESLHDKVAACTELKKYGRGWSLRCQCIRQQDGELAPSIYRLITRHKHRYSVQQLCQAVDKYTEWLIKYNVPLFDLNPGNFVVVSDSYGGLKLICVDVKSILRSKEVIPVSRWSKILMRRKIKRRASRLKQQICAQLEHAIV